MQKPAAVSKLLHVGYNIKIHPDGWANVLVPLIGEELASHLRYKLYTCAIFKGEKLTMQSWVQKREGKLAAGVIYALFIERKRRLVVAEMRVGGQPFYLTLISEQNVPLQDLKKLANSGQLGERIEVKPQVEVDATPHAEYAS